MAKRTKKLNKSSLKLETLEQRQLLAGVSGAGTEVTPGGTGVVGDVEHYIQHSNGNKYDQVLMTGSSVSVMNDAGQVTRVSFLDMNGDIVQAEFSGSGTLTVSLENATTNVDPTNYKQEGVKYVQGLASFTIEGSKSDTNLTVFSVGSATAINQALFDDTHKGGNNTADVSRIAIVADPANPNGSTFGGIYAGNAVFTASSGPVGISAAGVQVQNKVVIGEINATSSATPTLVFGDKSQFGDVIVAGGGLVSANGKAIFNTGSYNFGLVLQAGQKSDGSVDAAETTQSQLSFTGNNPVAASTKTYELTTGVDTIVGTTGGDKISASDTTITGLDTINGGDGSDTLTINDVAGNTAATTLLSVSNVENLVINSTKGLAGNALNTTAWTGLTSAVLTLNATAGETITASSTTDLSIVNQSAQSVTVIGGGASLVIQNGAGAIQVGQTAVANAYTSADIKGGTTVQVRDYSKSGGGVGSTLTAVTLNGNTGDATLESNGLTTVNLSNITTADADTTITAAAGTRALTVNLNGVTATTGNLDDAEATSVTLNAVTANSSNLTLGAAKATSLTINATKDLSLADVNIAAAKTITITGAGKTTIGAASTVTALTTVDASAATGAVTITPTLGTGIVYTGGAGADTISLAASTKAITTGAGDDSVSLTANLGTGGTIDAGDGTDTLVLTAAVADTVDANTTFNGKISNFERLSVTGLAAETINLANIDGLSYVTATGANGATLSSMANNGTLVLGGATTAITVGVTGAADGTADSLNVSLGGVAAGTAYGTITAADVETVAITTDDTASTPTGIQHSVTIVDTAAKTITVSGDAGLALTHAGTALTSFDASGVTKGAVSFTTAALGAAATLKTGAGADTLVATLATKAVTIDAGAGANTITVNNDQANSITTGKDADSITTGTGNDTIVAGDGANTINAGAGNNSVTTGKDADNITTGAGNDTIVAGDGADTISSGTGLDVITGGGGNDNFVITAPLNGGAYATITDAAAGDTFTFADQGTETFATTKISLANTAAFQDYLNAAAASITATANGNYAWFEYAGDTYLVQDNSDLATFTNGTDIVVKLSGSVDLSKATGGTTNVLTIV